MWDGIFCGSLKAAQTILCSCFTDFEDFSPQVTFPGFTLQPLRLQACSFHSVLWRITSKVFKVLRALLYRGHSEEWKCYAGKLVIIQMCSPANNCNRGCISSSIFILYFSPTPTPAFIPSPGSPYYRHMHILLAYPSSTKLTCISLLILNSQYHAYLLNVSF